jgi:aminoglycoside phosphotransferase (APT) family kinase protein
MSLDREVLDEQLPALLMPFLGSSAIEDLQLLKGGYSREMWSFDSCADGGTPRPWILCADLKEGVVGSDSLDRQTEADLLAVVAESSVPVPAVLGSAGADNPLGVPWFIMERVAGTAAVGPLLRDPWYTEHRPAFAEQKAQILAAIHAIPAPLEVFGLRSSQLEPDQIAPDEIRRWAQALDHTPAARTATLDQAIEWLRSNLPGTPERVTIVHGDYRTGNLLYDHSGFRAVLDWEMAHIGDPVEDLGWAQLVCWRLGTGRVGGLVEFDDWPCLYEKMAGVSIDRDSLHFWETLCSLKMSVLAWRAVERTPDGPERDLLVKLYNDLGGELEHRLLV